MFVILVVDLLLLVVVVLVVATTIGRSFVSVHWLGRCAQSIPWKTRVSTVATSPKSARARG